MLSESGEYSGDIALDDIILGPSCRYTGQTFPRLKLNSVGEHLFLNEVGGQYFGDSPLILFVPSPPRFVCLHQFSVSGCCGRQKHSPCKIVYMNIAQF